MSEAGIAVEISSDVINQVLQPCVEQSFKDDLLTDDEIPNWLTENFVEDILQKFYKNGNLKVNYLRVKPCGGKGESYASTMYRVGTSFNDGKDQEKFRTYIMKTLPQLDIAMEKLGSKNYNVQNKEMEMYQKILPEFAKVLESINEDGNIFPSVVAIDTTLDLIILEDLAEKSFVMADRLKGLDLNHILMALRKLARIHAASLVVYEKNPSAFSLFDSGFFTRKTDALHVMYETLCDSFIAEVSTWAGYEYYAKKLVKVRENLIKNGQRTFDCDEGDLHVLTHGDLWTNNLLYKYDESGAPVDAILLDFQYACYGSPVLDLIYFLYTSTTDELRQEKMEELMQYYYYELKDLLERMGYEGTKIPTLQSFQIQVLKKYFYVFTSGLLIFGVMISKDSDADFESLMGRDKRSMGFKRRVYQNPSYISVAKKLLPMLDRKGILDDM